MFDSVFGEEAKKIEVIQRKTGEKIIEKVYSEQSMRICYGRPSSIAFTGRFLTRKWISHLYGAYNDSLGSRHKIRQFVDTMDIDLSECDRPISEYQSFNDFFARTLKKNARPINNIPNSVISPGDGRLLVFPSFDESTISFIKWAPIRLFDLFNENESLTSCYQNGSCAILRLCPVDYHRFHFPVSGKVGITKTISGLLHSVSPYALERRIPVYCLNKRTICEIESESCGRVVFMEIGALLVGTIVQTYRPATDIKKGDEKGYFKFGGSTVILFFEKGKINFDSDLVENSLAGFETLVKMGEQIGFSANK